MVFGDDGKVFVQTSQESDLTSSPKPPPSSLEVFYLASWGAFNLATNEIGTDF